jgi:glycosyltransferase involved in cell wall biosynthesis
VVSNIHVIDLDAYKTSFDNRKNLLFVGGYAHLPNIDGIKWFVDDIFPIVSKQIPGIKIHVVGSNMPKDLEQYLSKRKGVIVDGFVEDISPILTKSRVFVAPLRYGAGVKGKVGQAIEFGIPVVSTTIGAEGMKLKNGTSISLADSPEAFAQSIIDLYFDQKHWTKIQLAAKEVINTYFSSESAKKKLEKILK